MTKATILVCDDEPHIVHVVAAKLKNAGYDVVTAGDGEEAFEVAEQARPDLVITDYQMPFLSGLELCVKLKSHPDLGHVPAIMLTARGFSLGADDLKGTNIRKLMPKPFSPREVLLSVTQVLEAAAASEAVRAGCTGDPCDTDVTRTTGGTMAAGGAVAPAASTTASRASDS